jgi:hypothetical protein
MKLGLMLNHHYGTYPCQQEYTFVFHASTKENSSIPMWEIFVENYIQPSIPYVAFAPPHAQNVEENSIYQNLILSKLSSPYSSFH